MSLRTLEVLLPPDIPGSLLLKEANCAIIGSIQPRLSGSGDDGVMVSLSSAAAATSTSGEVAYSVMTFPSSTSGNSSEFLSKGFSPKRFSAKGQTNLISMERYYLNLYKQ